MKNGKKAEEEIQKTYIKKGNTYTHTHTEREEGTSKCVFP